MAIETLPVWPFEPNWSGTYTEALEWLTDILTSPKGAEQRRSLRLYPRKTIEFTSAVGNNDNQVLRQFLEAHGGRNFYLPQWHEAYRSTGAALAGADFIPVPGANNGGIRIGDVIFIGGVKARQYELAEVAAVSPTGITLVDPLESAWEAFSKIHPVRKARLDDQPTLRKITDRAISFTVSFRIMETNDDVIIENQVRDAGPMIMDGLITNAYHEETGRGGYFHSNSGTSEGQFIFIYGALRAYEALRTGTIEEKIVADYYLKLAQEMLDAMGDGSTTGPMLRQAIPTSVNTITLMHWLFAARGDVPEQGIVYEFETAPSGGTLVIPMNANGNTVHRVWQIYPSTSELLYPSPYSPSFDSASPAGDTSVTITEWERVGDTTVITIPSGASAPTWKIVYGYSKSASIPMGEGYEAFPSWTHIAPGYSACAPDTFRWFEQAMERAVALDDRSGKADDWQALRLAMRRSAVRGQAITDLREVFRPLPGFPAIPASGEPDGMYCFSDHPAATPPIAPGLDNNWTGYDFWSRASNGDIVGVIPASTVLNQVQIGRAFSETWRTATSYQDADQYLYVEVSASKKPVAANNDFFLVYLSSTMDFDPAQRWYADIGSLTEFVATTGDVIGFFIPRSAFRLRTYDESGNTVWGSAIPAGQHIENFGISSEMTGSYLIRLRTMRLVSDDTAEAVAGAPMPFFPGALPFAINADTIRQQFVGWNGSPFHGYQLPDFWWWIENDAEAVHPDLTAGDLPIPDRTTGAITYPITALTVGGISKPKHALLMEQQLMFLKHAQLQWEDDGGDAGPFAHTFVLNTPARSSIGNPTPHTWVYMNDDPNTRWVGYQVRIIESLALLIDLAKSDNSFQDAVNLAEQMAEDWLEWLNGAWPNLSGTIKGMPTDFDDPATGDPQTLYEEPHAAAIVLRACLWLEKAGRGNSMTNQALMTRCWNYLELIWRTEGEMCFTWSPDPDAKQWYGFWHGEILTTLADLVLHQVHAPMTINMTTVRQRMVQTRTWLSIYGVSYNNAGVPVSFLDTHDGFNVIATPPDEVESTDFAFTRMIDDLDNQTAIPRFFDIATIPFPTQKHNWVLSGRTNYDQFKRTLFALRGRGTALWLPSFTEDMTVVADTPAGDKYLTVENFGFTLSGGIRTGHEHIVIFYVDGTREYRRIVGSTILGVDSEVIGVDQAFYTGLKAADILRVSFMRLARLDQDRIEIVHVTDTQGVSKCSVTFKAAPNLRIVKLGF